MKPSKEISPEDKNIIRFWLDKTRTAVILRKVLCVWLRVKGHNAEDIAKMIGWSVGQVQKIQSVFMRSGESVFMSPGKGGRRNQRMTVIQETAFINSLRDQKTGAIFLKIPEIKRKYELSAKLPMNTVAESTIYRLLRRYGYKSAQLQDGRRVFKN